MTESPQREIEIADSVLAEALKRHRLQGHNMPTIAERMIMRGAQLLSALIGSDRASDITQNVAGAERVRASQALVGVDWADPSEEDHRGYVVAILDNAPPAFDRDMLFACAAIHAGLSIAARKGAIQATETLAGISSKIMELASDRQFRTGNPARDAN